MPTAASTAVPKLRRQFRQYCSNRRASFETGGFKLRDRLIQAVRIVRSAGGIFQKLRRPRNAPRPDAASRTFKRMRGRGRLKRHGASDAAKDDCGLAEEKFEDFALQPSVPKRHAPKVIPVDRRRPKLTIRRARQG
jgi:hypothetical protein